MDNDLFEELQPIKYRLFFHIRLTYQTKTRLLRNDTACSYQKRIKAKAIKHKKYVIWW